VMAEFNGRQGVGAKISLADLIVLAGCAAVEKAAGDAGVAASVPFTPGRVDTTQALTDVEMFTWLKPIVDGFRNYVGDEFGQISQGVSPEEFFLDKANLMKLTAPEWTVLTGGLRVLNANHDGSDNGVFTDRMGVLTNDFFVHLTDTDLVWEKADEAGLRFILKSREDGAVQFRATRNDLVFGSNSQLRSIADVYAGSDGHGRMVKDFIKAWDKVMMLDRYDVKGHKRYAPMAA
jgi:catalase-peroxidase